MVTKPTAGLKVKKSYILPTESIYVFMISTSPPPKNSDLIFLYKINRIFLSPEAVFLLRGTSGIFISNSG
jgi:hypothetical protein